MSFFGVTREKISKSIPHPNADRLSLCELEGLAFQFVTGLNEFNVGDEVLYFPVDSLLPLPLQEKMGLVGRLSGKEKNRIKTVRLRGEISQGIVGPLSLLNDKQDLTSPEDITEYLDVKKYEPPITPSKHGNLVGLPMGLSVYDIEGADRFVNVAERMMPMKVCITEKVEGSNFAVAYSVNNNKIYVLQRHHAIEPIDGHVHDYWKIAEEQRIIELVHLLSQNNTMNVVVYGEFVGPGYQGNYYNLKNHKVFLFDIKINDKWLDVDNFLNKIGNFYKDYNICVPCVPFISYNVILSEWLDGKTIQQISNGQSLLCDKPREGIVIKPMDNLWDETLRSRLILKQRSPEYLSKTEN